MIPLPAFAAVTLALAVPDVEGPVLRAEPAVAAPPRFRSVDLAGVDASTPPGARALKQRLAAQVRMDCATQLNGPASGIAYGPGKIPFAQPETPRARCVRRGLDEAASYRRALAAAAHGARRG